jgi:hypothetical protein
VALEPISASSEIVLSDRCVTRKKFLAARTYHGKPFVEFLKTLYDSMEMPEILYGGQSSAIDDAMSPQQPQERKGRVPYDMWAEEEEWVKFRTVPHSGHVPSNIATLVQQLFLTSSAGKRKRSDTAALAASSGNEGLIWQ